jgi:hypothetical protein
MKQTLMLLLLPAALLSLLPACQRREGAPTLPQPEPPKPERVHLVFRLVSAQTMNPVAGARVLVRRAGRERRAGEGEVLAEAVSDWSGRVEVVFERWHARDPVYLDIDGGPRYLHRYVWLDDTRYEPAPNVRTLWELNPEIGADFCFTVALLYSCGSSPRSDKPPRWTCEDCQGVPPRGGSSRRMERALRGRWRWRVLRNVSLRMPRGDVYIIAHPDFWPHNVWGYFEEAARRMERALRGRWRWRVLRNVWTDDPDAAWPPEVPQDAYILQIFLKEGRGPCLSVASNWLGQNGSRGRVDLCAGAMRNVGVILHEFGHVAGLHHLPRGVRGLMSSWVTYDDFTNPERWVVGSLRFRRTGLRAPDDQLQP